MAWKSGLPESFDADLEKMRVDTPRTYENLIRKRNALWMPQIEAQLRSGETATVLLILPIGLTLTPYARSTC